MQPFHASTVPLTGKNMIEASAGTGKTYSIALLTLRLVIEKNIPLPEILMVTFTKAAVAELEDRVRLFVRAAAQAAAGHSIDDKSIQELVKNYQQSISEEEVLRRLHLAVLQLDETQVMTIHSFCQQSLSEFAFESGQSFQLETLQNSSSLIDQAIHSFWRKHVATLPLPILSLMPSEFNVDKAREAIQLQENGKEFTVSYMDPQEMNFSDSIEYWYTQYQSATKRVSDTLQDLIKAFERHQDELLPALQQNTYANKSIYTHYPNMELMLESARSKITTGYVKKLFSIIWSPFETWCNQVKIKEEIITELPERLYKELLKYAAEYIRAQKENNQLMSFDDMIVFLHEALQGPRKQNLSSLLGGKYKAVFIDEFQDTDKLQYEIFRECFKQDQIVFYIGDPKQSIYAFRKADLHLYFQASKDVDTIYDMNMNYRSSAAFIEGMNHFFDIEDPFYFAVEQETLAYKPVLSPDPNPKLTLHYRDNPDAALFLTETKNNAADAAAQIQAVLSDPAWTATKGGKTVQLRPADIGVLVRAHKEGLAIQAALQERNIPAVLIADQKILASEEAKQIVYVLEAILQVDVQLIRRAVLQDYMQIETKDLDQLNDEQLVDYFSQIRTTALNEGIYQALHEWMRIFQIQNQLLREGTTLAEKKLTNLRQLIELLHKEETRQHRDLAELIQWLKKAQEEESNDGDEYKQRIESDEQAAKIMTIHKSKGLEFPVVFLPFFPESDHSKGTKLFAAHRNPRTQRYEFVLKKRENEEQKSWMEQQNIQEDRRLLYVALTRGVAACFLFYKQIQGPSATFLSHLLEHPHPSVHTLDANLALPERWLDKHRSQTEMITRAANQFQLTDANWRRVSYTGLAAKHEPIKRGKSLSNYTDYNQFVFQQLSRGAQTGNLLHYLFEHIDFSNDQHWSKVVHRSIQRYDPDKHDSYAQPLLALVSETLQSKIEIDGQTIDLQRVPFNKRLQELEFDILLDEMYPNQLEKFSQPDRQIAVQAYPSIQGILNGKIDLFFEQDGKYFILDWKSNYLGDQVSDYAPSLLTQAMNENNYHLQYLLYTVAVKKYLSSRMPEFDYEKDFGGVIYIFLRGARAGETSGVFTTKPDFQTISAIEQLWSTKQAL